MLICRCIDKPYKYILLLLSVLQLCTKIKLTTFIYIALYKLLFTVYVWLLYGSDCFDFIAKVPSHVGVHFQF